MSTQFDLDVSTVAGMIRTACLLECAARKPGNVHPGASFDDLTFEHFVRSAEVVAPILAEASSIGVTQAILRAVEATQQQVGTNSNLGLILLLAPLAAVPLESRLSLRESASFRGAKGDYGLTPERVGEVLEALTVEDTRCLYKAIRLARPGGMGVAPQQDLSESPSVTVVEAMTLAADRDVVARQYRDQFRDVLETGVSVFLRWDERMKDESGRMKTVRTSPILTRPSSPILHSSPCWELAVIGLQLSLVARYGDSLIARKCGEAISHTVSQRAQRVLQLDWPFTDSGWEELDRFDQWLREDGHRRNPGTTADMIGAILFAALRTGRWRPSETTE